MTEEFMKENEDFINAHLPPEQRNEYVPGSAAPKLPEREQTPKTHEEPEKKHKRAPKPKEKRPTFRFSSALTVLGIITVTLCAFFLLTREVAIQKQKDAILELRDEIKTLYTQRDTLTIQYNSSINVDNIRDNAIKYGMHEPEEGQLIKID